MGATQDFKPERKVVRMREMVGIAREGADPGDTVETEMPGHGEKLVTRTGQAQGWQGRGPGRFQVSGQLEGCGDFH